MKEKLIKIVKSEGGKIVLALIVGVAIGAIFYPSKSIKEEERQRYEERIQKEVDYSRKLQQDHREQIAAVRNESREREEQLSVKINKQQTEITNLRSKVSERTYKLVKPDGTIEERTFKESELAKDSTVITSIRTEFDKKVKDIERRYESIHRERLIKIKEQTDQKIREKELRIAELEKKKTVEINKRSFGVAAGIMTDQSYFGSVERDIFGPIYLQGLIQVNPQNSSDNKGGVGIGIRF